MPQRIGYLATLQPSTPPLDAWIDLTSLSTSNFGEYGTTAGAHVGIGVWAYLKVPSSATNTKCVLRNATTGAHIDSSPVVSVTSTTGAWYFYALTGTYTETEIAFLIYADNNADLSYARTTNPGDNIKKHLYDSNAMFDTPTTPVSGWADNNHDMFTYFEYEDAGISADQTEAGDTQVAAFTVVGNPTITASQLEAGDTQVALIVVPFLPLNISANQLEDGDTQVAFVLASSNSGLVNIAPRAGWDYVNMTVLSPTSDLVPYSPLPQVGDQIYGEVLSDAVFYKKDGTTFLTSAPQFAVVNVHDGSVWGAEQFLTLEQANRSLSISLADINENLLLNLTNIEWGWFDELGPSSFTILRDSGLVETTNGSGILDINISATKVAFGDMGSLSIESDIDFGEGEVKASGLYRVVLL